MPHQSEVAAQDTDEVCPQFSGAYLFLTNRCNLRCRYCYVPQADPADISEQVIRWTADFLIKHAGAQRRLGLVLFGGEPLLVLDRTWTALDYARSAARRYGKFVGVTLVTNGLLLGPELAQEALRRNCLIHISCDGPDDTERCFADGTPSYPALRAALVKLAPLLRQYPAQFLVRITVGCHNLNLVRCVSDAVELGFRHVQLDTVSGIGPSALDSDSVSAFRESLMSLADWYLRRVQAGSEVPQIMTFDDVLRGLGRAGDDPYEVACCQAGRSQLAVGEDGRLYFCNGWYRESAFQVGQLPDGLTPGGFDWFPETERRARSICDQCRYRHVCNILCWKDNLERTGDAGTPDPVNCEIAKAYADTARTIYEATGATTYELSGEGSAADLRGRPWCLETCAT